MFFETFVTMYLYKRDSNTLERTCLLIHNYFLIERENSQEKKGF